MLESCTTPQESRAWVDTLAAEKVPEDAIQGNIGKCLGPTERDKTRPLNTSGLAVALQKGTKRLIISKADLSDICMAISRPAPEMISARKNSVELRQRPDRVMAFIGSIIDEYLEEGHTDLEQQ